MKESHFGFILLFWGYVLAVVECGGQTPAGETRLRLTPGAGNQLTITDKGNREYLLQTTGTDPSITADPLAAANPAQNYTLSFDYICPTGLDHFQVFLGPPDEEGRSKRSPINPTSNWTTVSISLREEMAQFKWGKKGDHVRLDFGGLPDRTIRLRNLRLRPPSGQERSARTAASRLDQSVQAYLNRTYPARIQSVSVSPTKITIKGLLPNQGGEFYLAESAVHQDVTEPSSPGQLSRIPSRSGNFTVTLDRYRRTGSRPLDRLLSRWVIVRKSGQGTELASHARYADAVQSVWKLPNEKPASKKGLGGFNALGPATDLDQLGIASVTVNIPLLQFMRSKAGPNTLAFQYGGKTFYADAKEIDYFDRTLRSTAQRKIIVSAIILINRAAQAPDKVVGRIFEHPDCDPAGIYSMANVATAEGLDYYAAAIDFLAKRYSRPDKQFGRIHHWIIHNEVDDGWNWTNAGEKTALAYMDQYHKSMRTVYYIARSYNPYAKVFISLTHHWNRASERHSYQPDDLLEYLLTYSRREGDFEWGIAYHPYPESLLEPKSWLDRNVDFTFKTPLITFKNIEVLDAWARQPRTFFRSKTRRSVHLTEQGTNSPDYSEKSLTEQAAGLAYAWKKIKDLPTIEAFMYHNWGDNPGESGLRIGLRRLPNDPTNPGGPKTIWFLYQKLGTAREEEATEFAKPLIGIQRWEQVRHQGPITTGKN